MTLSQPPDFHDAGRATTAHVLPAAPQIYELHDRYLTGDFLNNLKAAERVQGFSSDQDVQTRISHPRRTIYAWIDPSDPLNKALISVQVAFTTGKPGNIQSIIAAEDSVKGQPDTATFYSISNWSASAGSLGKPFLMAVVEALQEKHPYLQNFVTLSPMPNFRAWASNLTDEAAIDLGVPRLLQTSFAPFQQRVLKASSLDDLQKDPVLFGDFQKLAALYVTSGYQKEGRFTSHDRVAGFHLRNGAEAGHLCSAADHSQQGFLDSFGFMMNYVYPVKGQASPLLSDNAEAYRQGKPARSQEIQNLLNTRGVPRADQAMHPQPEG